MDNTKFVLDGDEFRVVENKSRVGNRNNCYYADLDNNGKFMCPRCKSIEKGDLRIITHSYINGEKCLNDGKIYCQAPSIYLGGKRKSRQNKKRRNSKRKNSKRRNSRR